MRLQYPHCQSPSGHCHNATVAYQLVISVAHITSEEQEHPVPPRHDDEMPSVENEEEPFCCAG